MQAKEVMTSSDLLSWIAIGVVAILAGCTDDEQMLKSDCGTDQQLTLYCGFQNPEDIALTPDGKFLIVTEFGGVPNSRPGKLSLFSFAENARQELDIQIRENTWGDPDCPRDDVLVSPHGLDLITRSDGRYQLAITNHLPGETVEFFELFGDGGAWKLVWRGCVAAPQNKVFNDVALTGEGAFYATSMYDADMTFADIMAAGSVLADTGSVWRWNRSMGFDVVPGTNGSFPNGIGLSDDENYLYINYWFAKKTVKFDIEALRVEHIHTAGRPDNLSVIDGDIWVANHDITLNEMSDCPADIKQCLHPFTIHILSGEDLSVRKSFSFDSHAFGGATVAVPANDRVWLGTFHGDRLASFAF